jgi:hypothetical protein
MLDHDVVPKRFVLFGIISSAPLDTGFAIANKLAKIA